MKATSRRRRILEQFHEAGGGGGAQNQPLDAGSGRLLPPRHDDGRLFGFSDTGWWKSGLRQGKVAVEVSQLEATDTQCAGEIGSVMELLDQHGVEQVVRVIPNPVKDIGFNILSLFHDHSRPRIVTCKSLVEVGEVLGLSRGKCP